MGIGYNPKIVTDGLILCLDAANPKSYPGSGTTWTDLSFNKKNGTLTNGPTYGSDNGANISLDGVDDYISTNLVLPSPSTTPTTFDLVFKNNGTANYAGIMGASSWQISGFSFGHMNNTALRITYNNSGTGYEPSCTYDSSVISNAAVVFNGRDISVYRNGSLISSSTASFDAVGSGSSIQIGRNLQAGWVVSKINVYCAKIYNRALSAAEINQNFQAIRERYGI